MNKGIGKYPDVQRRWIHGEKPIKVRGWYVVDFEKGGSNSHKRWERDRRLRIE